MMKIGERVGTLTKLEIPICQKRVELVPPDASGYLLSRLEKLIITLVLVMYTYIYDTHYILTTT